MTSHRRQSRKPRPRVRGSRPLKRLVHIDGVAWSWRISRNWIEIRTPDLETTWSIHMTTWTGWTPDELDRARWKGSSLPTVTPADVKAYIESTQETKA